MIEDVTIIQVANLARYFKVNPISECWDWIGALTAAGYGTIEINYRQTSAHKWVYALCSGFWPDKKLNLDHLCRNRHCVNPRHLELVTFRTNILRGIGIAAENTVKTHCINGHEFTPENTYNRQRPGRQPERACKSCINAATRRYINKKARIELLVN